MTKLLDEALAAVRKLPTGTQDDIAGVVLRLIGKDEPSRVLLTTEERAAIAASKAAASRGEFATDEEVQAVWTTHAT